MAKPSSYRVLLVLCGILLVCLMGIIPVAAIQFQVYSNPSDAEVSVDNFWFDRTPATIQYPESGWHTIRVSREGYQTVVRSEYCTGGNNDVCVVSYDLSPNTPAYGFLSINTNNEVALTVDGIFQGYGSMIIPLYPGSHTMTLKKPGYYDYTETFTIYDGQTTTRSPAMNPYPQQPQYGSLQIDSEPPGASVYLDNRYMGIEPATGAFYITDLAPGTYTLSLVMPDYQTWTQRVQVQAGIVNDIWPKLMPNPAGPVPDTTGQIFAYSTPAGANVYVDNAYKGITPVTLRDIPAGSHTVTFKLMGYQDYSTVAIVSGGTIINVPATLPLGQAANVPAAAATPTPTKTALSSLTAIVALGICCAGLLAARKG
jgi:hypothetical protein